MPTGSRHRLVGLLLSSARGPLLQLDDGGAYALDLDDEVRNLIGRRVVVEGIRSGFDRLDVHWIDAA